MTDFADYTAAEIANDVAAYGFWWIDEQSEIKDVTADDEIVFANGTTKKITGTACRAAWAQFKKDNPNASLAVNRQYDIDAEIAGVMAQYVALGELVYG